MTEAFCSARSVCWSRGANCWRTVCRLRSVSAFDILLLLVSRHGQLVTKDETHDRGLARVVVEETNIQVHVSALQQFLGTAGDGALLPRSPDGAIASWRRWSARRRPRLGP